MAEGQWETIAIRTTRAMAQEFERARLLLGFQSRAAYLWFLHVARRGGNDMTQLEKEVLLELAHYGNLKSIESTPTTQKLAQYVGRSGTDGVDAVEKALEKLEMKEFVKVLPTPIRGMFANDVVTRDKRRYGVTPSGGEALRALGYEPKWVG